MKNNSLSLILFFLLLIPLTACVSADYITSGAGSSPAVALDPSQDRAMPLMRAVEMGDVAAVKKLLAQGIDPDSRQKSSLTPLMQTLARHGDGKEGTKIALALIEYGADVNHRSANYDTPLIFAGRYNNKKVAKALLQKGADVNARNAQGVNASFDALIHRNYQVWEFLLDQGGDYNAQDILGMTQLMWAIGYTPKDEYGLTTYFLVSKRKADLNLIDNNGNSVTSYCRFHGVEDWLRSEGATGKPSTRPMEDTLPASIDNGTGDILGALFEIAAPMMADALMGSMSINPKTGMGFDSNSLISSLTQMAAEQALADSTPGPGSNSAGNNIADALMGSMSFDPKTGMGFDPNTLVSSMTQLLVEEALSEPAPAEQAAKKPKAKPAEIKRDLMLQAPHHSSSTAEHRVGKGTGRSIVALGLTLTKAWTGVGAEKP